jgi:hypothetical protein
MQCSELEFVFEQEGIPPLALEAREHLAHCRSCKQFVEEVTSIVALAHQLPAEVEPPQRLWISIRAELEREGIIRGTPLKESTSWWESFSDMFHHRVLATAGVAALLIVAAGVSFRPSPQGTVIVEEVPSSVEVPPTVGQVLSRQETDVSSMYQASTNSSPVDTSLRQNLQQVDAFIADCEQRLKVVPSDELARDYLTNAYQQKARLLSAMMDRGRSLN